MLASVSFENLTPVLPTAAAPRRPESCKPKFCIAAKMAKTVVSTPAGHSLLIKTVAGMSSRVVAMGFNAWVPMMKPKRSSRRYGVSLRKLTSVPEMKGKMLKTLLLKFVNIPMSKKAATHVNNVVTQKAARAGQCDTYFSNKATPPKVAKLPATKPNVWYTLFENRGVSPDGHMSALAVYHCCRG